MARIIGLVVAFALVSIDSGRAEASCALGTRCLCTGGPRSQEGTGNATVYEARVTQVGPETTFQVTATHGVSPDAGPPATVTLEARGERVGERYLVSPDADWRTRIDSGDVIRCGNLRVPLAEAIDIALSEDCYDQLIAMGFVQECNDVGHACAVGSSSPGSLLAVAALLLVLRARRRSRPSCADR